MAKEAILMKIRYFCTNPHNAISWYRAAGGLEKLKYIDPSIQVHLTEQVDWQSFIDADIVYIQNPYDWAQYMAAVFAKEMGLPVWIDYDDDVLNIANTHPRFVDFSAITVKEVIWKSMELADVVTVPTAALALTAKEYNKHVVVVPNAFNDYNMVMPGCSNETDSIAWRGGDTHWDDLDDLHVAFKALSEKHPEWSWHFIGLDADTKHITRDMPNSFAIAGKHLLPLITCFQKMRDTKPAVFIHHLIDNLFNRAKSNISWIEATMSGAATLMPALPEFDRPGVAAYSSVEEFMGSMEKLMKSDNLREKLFQESRTYILDNLKLSNINKIRVDIAHLLTGRVAL